MTEAGAILSQTDAPKSRYRGWRRGDTGFAGRFRKPIVAATLAFGDVVSAIAAISLSRALIGMTGAQTSGRNYLLIAFLILMLFCVRLYTGCGPSVLNLKFGGLRIDSIIADSLVFGRAGDGSWLCSAGAG